MRKSLNAQYLAVIVVLMGVLLGIEAILSVVGVQESMAFPIFWLVFFCWILFGKKLLKKRARCILLKR